MSDQSDGPLSEEHICTHTFLMKRDGRGVISVSVQPSCLVPYLPFSFYRPVFTLVLVLDFLKIQWVTAKISLNSLDRI
jgi:hypothetical protein